MKTKLTPIAAAAAIAIAGAMSLPAFAQTAVAPAAAASAAKADDIQRVEVTGIRGSLQTSISQKRNADSHVEVITAEDIGKLPDKNVADSLAHVPGLTISSAGANEGGFDESDRVSMRGTSPSLTQTTINGHAVGSGDWFVLDQVGTVGRSVSYTLLPTEIVGSVVVHKTSQADLIEGGVAGSIDIITRKPLDFKKPFSVSASVGVVHADLPNKTDPQLSALANWRNESGTFGVLLQGFSETRHLRRDGVEVLQYDKILASTAANPSAFALAHPDAVGKSYASLMGAVNFLQSRKRTGGLFDVEFKPNSTVMLDLNGFTSHLEATNINRNYLYDVRGSNGGLSYGPTAYTISGDTITSATYANDGNRHGVYDQISRPKASADSRYLDLDGKFNLTSSLVLNTSIGTTQGHGKSPTQDVAEFDILNTGAAYQLNGKGSAASFSLPGANYASPLPYGTATNADWIFGAQNVNVIDKEHWEKIDGEFAIEAGPLVSLKFGARATDHQRTLDGVIAQGPKAGFNVPANYPTSATNYPSNFGKGIGSGFPTGIWEFTPEQLKAYNDAYANRDPVSRAYYQQDFGVHEKVNAAYLQGNLEGSQWSGNVGVRVVSTKESVRNYQNDVAHTPGHVTSAWGDFIAVTTNHTYNDVLPSANLKLDLSKEMLVRFAASRTMTRADYSQLGGSVALGNVNDANLTGVGSGGNPDLKPITSNNYDASFEWYFAPRALVSASLFYMDLTSYIDFGSVHKTYNVIDSTNPNGAQVDFDLTVPLNSKGTVKGIELAWEQPVFGNFGVNANFTYADSKAALGGSLVGASKSTYNLGAYFENDMFNARVSYNHRSSFYSGLDRSSAFFQDGVGDVNASLGYTLNKYVNFTFDARNLNNPKLKYYASAEQPRAIYVNGRQFFLAAHYTY